MVYVSKHNLTDYTVVVWFSSFVSRFSYQAPTRLGIPRGQSVYLPNSFITAIAFAFVKLPVVVSLVVVFEYGKFPKPISIFKRRFALVSFHVRYMLALCRNVNKNSIVHSWPAPRRDTSLSVLLLWLDLGQVCFGPKAFGCPIFQMQEGVGRW